MSVRYPVPQPPRVPVAIVKPQNLRAPFLPAAPAADVELPPLTLAPMSPPGWPRWQ